MVSPLIGQIDTRVPDTGRKVSVGQAVQAMVLNGLGFVSRPLYLSPEFFRNKPVDLLIAEGLEADDLNEDSLGHALDHLYAVGITELFAAICAYALRVFGIKVRFSHIDTTAFGLEGQYKVEETNEEEPQAIRITYGYSKDRRPDLKQAIMGLICVNETSIPAYLTALSGNVSDKTSMPEMAKLYLDQFGEDEDTPILVADSALYGADNLRQLSEILWVTRVPATISEAKNLLAETTQEMMQSSKREGYFYHEVESSYGEIEQRWLVVVLYEPRREQELAQLQKRVRREADKLAKSLKKLQREAFNCEEDAQKALDDFAKQWSFHLVKGDVYDVTRYAQRGRPKEDSPTVTEWKLEAAFELDEETITQQQQFLGKYLIATNELDHEKLPAEELLTVYKDQNRSVERGFRFLKNPFFFASRFFLKKPSRIMALLMVMGLSLLIYALAEQMLRSKLAESGQSIPDQKGNRTQRPTMRRVFQMFEGIHILFVETTEARKRMVLNVQEVHLQIARLLGKPILQFYLLSE